MRCAQFYVHIRTCNVFICSSCFSLFDWLRLYSYSRRLQSRNNPINSSFQLSYFNRGLKFTLPVEKPRSRVTAPPCRCSSSLQSLQTALRIDSLLAVPGLYPTPDNRQAPDSCAAYFAEFCDAVKMQRKRYLRITLPCSLQSVAGRAAPCERPLIPPLAPDGSTLVER